MTARSSTNLKEFSVVIPPPTYMKELNCVKFQISYYPINIKVKDVIENKGIYLLKRAS